MRITRDASEPVQWVQSRTLLSRRVRQEETLREEAMRRHHRRLLSIGMLVCLTLLCSAPLIFIWVERLEVPTIHWRIGPVTVSWETALYSRNPDLPSGRVYRRYIPDTPVVVAVIAYHFSLRWGERDAHGAYPWSWYGSFQRCGNEADCDLVIVR